MKPGTLWRQVLTPAFVCACGLLLGTLMVRQYLVQGMGLILEKQPVSLRRPFHEIPRRLGAYEAVQEEILSPRQIKSLGTSAYLSRVYRDTRKVSERETGAAIWFYLVYYTGTAATLWVRHVPEECFVGAGHQKIDSRQAVLPPGALPVTLFHYLSADTGEAAYAVYFFIANGRYVVSRGELRLQLLDIRKKQSYYCQIELLPGTICYRPDQVGKAVFSGGLPNTEMTLQATAEFLTAALPELWRCLPEAGDAP